MKASSLIALLVAFSSVLSGQETYTVVKGGGSWASEISMDLLDGDDNLITTFTETTGTDILLEEDCYTLVMYDSYGDGWSGNTYTIFDSTGSLIASGNLDGAESGDELTIGYDTLCLTGSPTVCEHTTLSIYSGGGYYDYEISWAIEDEDGNVMATHENEGTVSVCLEDGCYNFVMSDDWGDGWNGAAYTISDEFGAMLAVGALEDGFSDTDQFSVGSGVCDDGDPANYTPQDCAGAIVICTDETFGGNADAYGIEQDLNVFNRGCLTLEHQSGWYVFSPITPGTISFTLTPTNGIDYDFAIWGPYDNVDCPPLEDPLRCSYSALYEPTGMEVGTSEGDSSEDPDGDAWVEAITVENADLDKYYLMLIDNYTTDYTAFDFAWDLDGVTLNCSLQLPVELVGFRGTEGDDAHILEWETQTELNNAFFEIERSRNGNIWQAIERVGGFGNSTIPHSYRYEDVEPPFGTTYYRLRQVDFNGQYE